MNLRSRSKVSAEFSMSSMTDLVFLLLIFFIITSTLVTSSALDVILPRSKAQTVKKHNLTVTISPDLQFSIDGDLVSYDAVESAILAKISRIEEAEPVIILRADEMVPTGETIRVLDIGYRHRLKMIIATDPK
jgi:biopolymer transport protein ExbD